VDPHSCRHTVTGLSAPRTAQHAARPPVPWARTITAIAGGAIVLATVALGAAAWLADGGGGSDSTPTSARLITVTPGPGRGVDTAVKTP
jgi:hypothetical protein